MSVFLFCELGEQVAKQFKIFEDELCECNWYSFPIEMQQMFPIVIMNTQQPVNIRGYGNTLCTREAFRKVNSY